LKEQICEDIQMDKLQVDNTVTIELNEDGNNRLVQQTSSEI